MIKKHLRVFVRNSIRAEVLSSASLCKPPEHVTLHCGIHSHCWSTYSCPVTSQQCTGDMDYKAMERWRGKREIVKGKGSRNRNGVTSLLGRLVYLDVWFFSSSTFETESLNPSYLEQHACLWSLCQVLHGFLKLRWNWSSDRSFVLYCDVH